MVGKEEEKQEKEKETRELKSEGIVERIRRRSGTDPGL